MSNSYLLGVAHLLATCTRVLLTFAYSTADKKVITLVVYQYSLHALDKRKIGCLFKVFIILV